MYKTGASAQPQLEMSPPTPPQYSEWKPEVQRAWDQFDDDPSQFYFLQNHPAQKNRVGPWAAREVKHLIGLFDFCGGEFDKVNWGTLGSMMPGRIGKACRDKMELLIREGVVQHNGTVNGKKLNTDTDRISPKRTRFEEPRPASVNGGTNGAQQSKEPDSGGVASVPTAAELLDIEESKEKVRQRDLVISHQRVRIAELEGHVLELTVALAGYRGEALQAGGAEPRKENGGAAQAEQVNAEVVITEEKKAGAANGKEGDDLSESLRSSDKDEKKDSAKGVDGGDSSSALEMSANSTAQTPTSSTERPASQDKQRKISEPDDPVLPKPRQKQRIATAKKTVSPASAKLAPITKHRPIAVARKTVSSLSSLKPKPSAAKGASAVKKSQFAPVAAPSDKKSPSKGDGGAGRRGANTRSSRKNGEEGSDDELRDADFEYEDVEEENYNHDVPDEPEKSIHSDYDDDENDDEISKKRPAPEMKRAVTTKTAKKTVSSAALSRATKALLGVKTVTSAAQAVRVGGSGNVASNGTVEKTPQEKPDVALLPRKAPQQVSMADPGPVVARKTVNPATKRPIPWLAQKTSAKVLRARGVFLSDSEDDD